MSRFTIKQVVTGLKAHGLPVLKTEQGDIEQVDPCVYITENIYVQIPLYSQGLVLVSVNEAHTEWTDYPERPTIKAIVADYVRVSKAVAKAATPRPEKTTRTIMIPVEQAAKCQALLEKGNKVERVSHSRTNKGAKAVVFTKTVFHQGRQEELKQITVVYPDATTEAFFGNAFKIRSF